MKKIFKHFIFLPIIFLAAIAFVVFQVKSKPPIEHKVAQFPVKAVEVISLNSIAFRARAVAFGHVEPSEVFRAKSEVSGKISYIHPGLKKGASLQQGTVVLRIEPTSFELSLNQSKAGLAGSESSLAQLESEEKSTQRALAISQENLSVGIKELNRIKALWDKRLISLSTLEKEEQKVLSLRQQRQDIQGKLSSYKSRKAATRAQITQSKSQVDQSQDTLGKTEVKMPFTARIAQVSIEKGEFTPAGALLFEALGVEGVEITAQLPSKQFRPLVAGLSLTGNAPNKALSLDFDNPASLETILKKMNLEARVKLVGDSDNAAGEWVGQLLRLSESVDPTRDTLGLVIAVDKPYEGIIPGKRPPLLKGMYTSVELFSPPRPALVLPRKALHQGRLYSVDSDNKLKIQVADVLFYQGDLLVLDADKNKGLIGKKIIISDVVPVIEGMSLKPIEASDYEKLLAQKALGLQ
jgi:multidrug efflux pump subunit AcrA (membrane-fusion protein)